MGAATEFERELLLMGILLGADRDWSEVRAILQAEFGPIASSTEEEPFSWTSYYEREMGPGIRRLYILFRDPVDPAALASIKVKTNNLELVWAREGARGVNIDPGILSPARLCLATTKDRAHRLPLSSGIYGELTLIYERGEFRALPWTYADWASPRVRALLGIWRKSCPPLAGRRRA